ncbi:type II toxin-antitoxin system CcdA family antitoxin [Enterobacter asburiae]|uniref:type II toxin-antitoxin system CcdA family antitoxin n=1 Tax=Scandinavium sp. UTDF21-P1B TaxID=3446379 RepID=UPI00347A7D9E
MPVVHVRHKKTVSVTLEPGLLQQARDAGLNLSAVLTDALKQAIDASGNERWKQENRAGLQELNLISDEHELLSDDFRTF